jgi:hypothetical protein
MLTFLLATLALMPNNWGSPADFGKQWIAELILLSVLVLGVRYIMRFNILGCFLVLATIGLAGAAAELIAQRDRFYKGNGYTVVFALVMLLAWPVFAWRAGSASNAVVTPPVDAA